MKKRTWLLLPLVILATTGLTPRAIAATPEIDLVSGEFPVSAVGHLVGGSFSTAEGLTIGCSTSAGTGKATSKTTGEGSYGFTGCKDSIFGSSCTSPGRPAGNILLQGLTMHLVYLDHNHTRPGVLTTPPAGGVFAKFTCVGGFYTIEVKGDGVLSEITAPKCGATSQVATSVARTLSHGVQEYRQVEETGTVYDMTATVNAGAPQTAGLSASVTATAERAGTLTCPEQK
jgi:hypothetical protein